MTHPWRPGQVLTEQRLNQGYMIGRTVARLRRETAQSISNQTVSPSVADAIRWQSAERDLLDAWDDSVNPSRFTPPLPGLYRFYGGVGFAGTSGGNRRGCGWAVNGSLFDSTLNLHDSGNWPSINLRVEAPAAFEAQLDGFSDYVELVPHQNSGGSLNTATLVRFQPSMTVVYAGPLS